MWKPACETFGMRKFRDEMKLEFPQLAISLHPSEVIDHEWWMVIRDRSTRTELPVNEPDFDDETQRRELVDVIQEAIRCQSSR